MRGRERGRLCWRVDFFFIFQQIAIKTSPEGRCLLCGCGSEPKHMYIYIVVQDAVVDSFILCCINAELLKLFCVKGHASVCWIHSNTCWWSKGLWNINAFLPLMIHKLHSDTCTLHLLQARLRRKECGVWSMRRKSSCPPSSHIFTHCMREPRDLNVSK